MGCRRTSIGGAFAAGTSSRSGRPSAAWRFGLREGVLVLRYHRIGEHDGDPWPLAVSAENFAQQLDVLARAVRVLSLAELVRRLADGRPLGRAVVLTFDDGYADNLPARLFIERHGMSATVFVITGHTGAGREPGTTSSAGSCSPVTRRPRPSSWTSEGGAIASTSPQMPDGTHASLSITSFGGFWSPCPWMSNRQRWMCSTIGPASQARCGHPGAC